MASCCNPRGCDRFFTPRFARRVARRYRKRGLDKTARRMIGFLEAAGIEGATRLTPLRREHVGFVLQFFDLLPSQTAGDNVTLPAVIASGRSQRALPIRRLSADRP